MKWQSNYDEAEGGPTDDDAIEVETGECQTCGEESCDLSENDLCESCEDNWQEDAAFDAYADQVTRRQEDGYRDA